MTDPISTRRAVFHIGGYDFTMPAEAAHRRFVRELRRFEATWSLRAVASDPVIAPSAVTWTITTEGPGWRVGTDYRFLRWDDVIAEMGRAPAWRKIVRGLAAIADFVAGGALFGYVRTNWRYALFFLYPVILLLAFATAASLVGNAVAGALGSVVAGIGAGVASLAAMLRWPARWLLLYEMLDDWAFARRYVRTGDATVERRLDEAARELCATARSGAVGEVVVIGHSLGAVLAVDLIDRALAHDPALGRGGARVALVTVGSSILKIGLHRGAIRFHAAARRVASARDVFWVEYQALTDVMNFYKTDPIAEMGLDAPGPLVRVVRIRHMLDPAAYRRIKRNFFRVHCQFVSGNDRRAAYDFYMLMCGPVSAERQARAPEGAVSMIAPDGGFAALADPPRSDTLQDSA